MKTYEPVWIVFVQIRLISVQSVRFHFSVRWSLVFFICLRISRTATGGYNTVRQQRSWCNLIKNELTTTWILVHVRVSVYFQPPRMYTGSLELLINKLINPLLSVYVCEFVCMFFVVPVRLPLSRAMINSVNLNFARLVSFLHFFSFFYFCLDRTIFLFLFR